MELLSRCISDPNLWLILFGSFTNLCFVFASNFKNKDGSQAPIELGNSAFIFILFTYLLVGIFSYIFFYEDIKTFGHKTVITIGLTSYYFVGKIIEQYKKG